MGNVGNQYLSGFKHHPIHFILCSLRMAAERNITRPLYLIKINKISDRWIKRYMAAKAMRLKKALKENHLPEKCSVRERWNNRKCESYCDVVEFCPYGRLIKRAANKAA